MPLDSDVKVAVITSRKWDASRHYPGRAAAREQVFGQTPNNAHPSTLPVGPPGELDKINAASEQVVLLATDSPHTNLRLKYLLEWSGDE